MKPRSLMARLSSAIIGLAVLTLSAYLGWLYYNLLGPGASALDDQLRASALVVLRSAPVDIDRPDHRAVETFKSRLDVDNGEFPERFQLLSNDGRILLRSPQAPRQVMDPVLRPGANNVAIDGVPWRVVTVADDQHRILVQYGFPKTDLLDQMRAGASGLSMQLLPIFLVQLLATLFVAWWTLRPLRALRDAIDRRDAEGTDRIAVKALPSEIEPIVVSMNGLLSRVEQAREHERRFLAEAAHELRTPLTAIRLQAQAAERTSDPDERRRVLEDLRIGIDRTARLANQMLDAARLQARQRGAIAREVCDIDKLIVDAIEGLTMPGLHKRGAVTVQPCGLEANLDPSLLQLALRNLVHNALLHGGEAVRVEIAAHARGDALLIDVFDTGPGLPPEFAEQDTDAGTSRFGGGLGLGIVRGACEMSGGALRLHSVSGRRGLQPTLWVPSVVM